MLDLVHSWIGDKNPKCYLKRRQKHFSVRIRNTIVDLLVIHHTDRSPSLQGKDFFGSDILAKRDFFGSMKDAGIFLGRENNRGIFWGIVFFISSNQK